MTDSTTSSDKPDQVRAVIPAWRRTTRRVWHGALMAAAILAIPGIWIGGSTGILERSFSNFAFGLIAVGTLVNFLVWRNYGTEVLEDEEPTPLVIRLMVEWFFFSLVAIPAGSAVYTLVQMNSPLAYQYGHGYERARYVDPNGRFQLEYPADWSVLTAAEARVQFSDRLNVTPTAVLFIGASPAWLENMNIQMMPARYRDGEIFGDDEEELDQIAQAGREELQRMFPSGIVHFYETYEQDGRQWLKLSVTRRDTGLRTRQNQYLVVMNGRQLIFTTTAPTEVAPGHERFRFANMLKSFEVLPAGDR